MTGTRPAPTSDPHICKRRIIPKSTLGVPFRGICSDDRRLPLFPAQATPRELVAGLQERATGGLADPVVWNPCAVASNILFI